MVNVFSSICDCGDKEKVEKLWAIYSDLHVLHVFGKFS